MTGREPTMLGSAADRSQVALDTSASATLKQRASAGSPEGADQGAAKQFEALFMQQLMKSMRDATPQAA